jgi:ribosomal protein S18 acetylase RimI-like enzyme
MAFSKRGHRLKAARHLIESFDLSLRKPIRVLKKDKNIRTLLSRTDQSLRTHGILFMMNHYRKYEALSLVDVPAVRGLDALVYYKMKALVALKRQDDAKALYREYAAAVARKPEMRHRPGLGQALLRRVVAVYGALARGYAKRIR